MNVTGPPGSGKTTTARLVAQQSELGVHLEADAFWQFIQHGWIAPWEPASQAQNVTVLQVVSAAIAFVQGGYFVVRDEIVGPGFLDLALTLTRAADVCVYYVILRPPPGSRTQPRPTTLG